MLGDPNICGMSNLYACPTDVDRPSTLPHPHNDPPTLEGADPVASLPIPEHRLLVMAGAVYAQGHV